MSFLGGCVELRPLAPQVLRKSNVAKCGGEMEGPLAFVGTGAGLRPPARQVLRKSNKAANDCQMEGLVSCLGGCAELCSRPARQEVLRKSKMAL